MPALWAYARDLFQTPGFGDTVDFDHIKRHYYRTHPHINPTGIVPRARPVGVVDATWPRGVVLVISG
jgi:glutathionyl-hydroquinone reductase